MLKLRMIALLFLVAPEFSIAAILLDARELYKKNPVTQADKGIAIGAPNGSAIGVVKASHLAALIEAHEKIGAVSGVNNTTLKIFVSDSLNAFANPRQNVIAFSTGILNEFGHDKNMLAGVMGHEFAHLSLRHAFERIVNIPNVLRGAKLNADSAMRETGSKVAANYVGQITEGLLIQSFSRQQEYEADSLGAEFMSKAGYDPKGVTDMFAAMLKATGNKTANYFDSHPGFEERISNAEPVIANQRFVSVAERYHRLRRWSALAGLVDQWLRSFPESGDAWYYRGLVLKARKNPEALFSFARAVKISPSLSDARFELCVALYKSGQERESLICAEGLALNDERERFVEQTFKHIIYVAGYSARRFISEEDALIISLVLGRPDLAPRRTLSGGAAEEGRQARNRNQEIIDGRRVSYHQQLCERSKNMPNGPLRAAYVKRDCDAYDAAVRAQHLNALNR